LAIYALFNKFLKQSTTRLEIVVQTVKMPNFSTHQEQKEKVQDFLFSSIFIYLKKFYIIPVTYHS